MIALEWEADDGSAYAVEVDGARYDFFAEEVDLTNARIAWSRYIEPDECVWSSRPSPVQTIGDLPPSVLGRLVDDIARRAEDDLTMEVA